MRWVLILGLVLAACGKGREGPVAVRPDAPPAVEAFPAGPVRAEDIVVVHAIFFAPRPAVEPEAALAGACAEPAAAFDRVDEMRRAGPRPLLTVERPTAREYPPPPPEAVTEHGVGLLPEQVRGIRETAAPLVVAVWAPRALAGDALRAGARLVHCLAQATDGLVWDAATQQLFAVEAYRERRLDRWRGGPPAARDHVRIVITPHGDYLRAFTAGMAKLGLPDVVIDGFSREQVERVRLLVELIAQTLVEHDRVDEGGQLTLDPGSLADPALRGLAPPSGPGATGRAIVSAVVGRRQIGDPDNRLLQVRFEAPTGGGTRAEIAATLTALFGSQPVDARWADPDAELLEASRRARQRLEAFRAPLAAGLPARARLQVKAPFTTPSGPPEYMWVDVVGWKDGILRGVLVDSAVHIPGLREGADVGVVEATVFDYRYVHPDGHVEGNETQAILERTAGQQAPPR